MVTCIPKPVQIDNRRVSYVGGEVDGPHVSFTQDRLGINADDVLNRLKQAIEMSISQLGVIELDYGQDRVNPDPGSMWLKSFKESTASYTPKVTELMEDLSGKLPANCELILVGNLLNKNDFWIAININYE